MIPNQGLFIQVNVVNSRYLISVYQSVYLFIYYSIDLIIYLSLGSYLSMLFIFRTFDDPADLRNFDPVYSSSGIYLFVYN